MRSYAELHIRCCKKFGAVLNRLVQIFSIRNRLSSPTAGQNEIFGEPDLFFHVSRGCAGGNSEVGISPACRGNDGYILHSFGFLLALVFAPLLPQLTARLLHVTTNPVAGGTMPAFLVFDRSKAPGCSARLKREISGTAGAGDISSVEFWAYSSSPRSGSIKVSAASDRLNRVEQLTKLGATIALSFPLDARNEVTEKKSPSPLTKTALSKSFSQQPATACTAKSVSQFPLSWP